MLIGIGLVVLLLIVNVAITYHNTYTLKDDADWVDHSDQVLDQSANVMLLLVDMEPSERGYVITGNNDFLEPYRLANAKLDAAMASLKQLAKANGVLMPTIEKLESMEKDRVAITKKTIALREKSEPAARDFIASKEGKNSMDAIRSVVVNITQSEHRLRQGRSGLSQSAYQFAIVSEATAGLLAILLFLGFIWNIGRGMAARQRDAEAINRQREWFRTTLASIGDGVIATDTQGNVSFLNTVAQQLTGWSDQEAKGQPLVKMFNIVNEQTRQTAENPVYRVLRDGVIAGLANHTILISKSGAECPIEDMPPPFAMPRERSLASCWCFIASPNGGS